MARLLAASTLAVLALAACGSAAPEPPAAAQRVLRLSTPRATHAIVRSGERLLLIGGCVSDGCEPGPESATVDMVGPDGRVETGRLLLPRVQPAAATLPDGRVLVIGGWVAGRVTRSTEIFDPRRGTSSAGPDLLAPRNAPAVAVLQDGRILVAGGSGGGSAVASAEIYDPRSGRFDRAGDLVEARSGATASTLPDGRVLIAGGGTGESAGRMALASTELFDPATGRFSAGRPLAQRRYKHGAVVLPDGDVLVIGGSDERDYGGKLDQVERFDLAKGRWAAAGRLAEARFKLADASVLLPSGKVLVAGGFERPELFDPATGRSVLLTESLGGRWNYLTAALLGGRVFLAGGYSEGTIRVSDRAWLLNL
jgi:hypothetical protein